MRLTSLLLVWTALCLASAWADEGSLLQLSQGGRSPYAIAVSEGIAGDPQSKKAVEKFSSDLSEITGATFPIFPSGEKKPEHAIFFGLAAEFPSLASAAGLPDRGENAFLLKSDGTSLYIVGNSQSAVRNGAFTIMRELGCRWYFPGNLWSHKPKIPDLSYQANRVEEPSFAFCRLFPGIGRLGVMDDWILKNRLGRYTKGYIHHRLGIDPALFSTHPEYFSLRNGNRTRKQLAIGNADARKLFIENSLEYLRKHPDHHLISVEPPDNLAHSEDPETLAIGNGTPSDAIFHLANETAKAVAKEFPDAYVGLYAYLAHADPPTFHLEPNVFVEVTTNLRQTKLSIPEAIAQFQQRGAKVGLRDYLSVPQWHQGRIGGGSKGSNFIDTPKEIAGLGKLGVIGYSGEMSENWAPNGLTYYLLAQVLWNRDCDLAGETDLFFRSMFGDAAPAIRGMYERWQKKGLTRVETASDSIKRLKEAYAATSDPVIRKRIDELGMAVYWNYLYYELEQAALRNIDSLDLAESGILRRFVRWSARIDSTGMIDTYAVSRVFYRSGVLKRLAEVSERTGVKIETLTNGLNGKWWVADRTLGVPESAEVWKNLGEAEQALAKMGLSAERQIGAVPKSLIPARTDKQTFKNPPASDFPLPKGIPLIVWANEGETVRLPIAAPLQDLKQPMTVSYRVSPYGNQDTVLKEEEITLTQESGAWRKVPNPGELPVVEFSADQTGAYVIRLESDARSLGLVFSDDLKKRPMALAPFLGTDEDSYEEKFILIPQDEYSFYFRWPKNVSDALLVGSRNRAAVRVSSASGPILEESDFGSEQMKAIVPPKKQAGEIMELMVGKVTFTVRGFPLLLSPSPGQTLMPEE